VDAHAQQFPQLRPHDAAGLTPLPQAVQQAYVASARWLARVLDEAVTIPGTRTKVGLDALLGLIPGIGDLGASVVGGYIVLVASRLGVPAVVLWRMMLNLALDAAVGVVPLVGDALDVAFRANMRNVALLERALTDPAGTRRASRWALAGLGAAFVAMTAAGTAGVILLFHWLRGG
jgi:hypothetical protein